MSTPVTQEALIAALLRELPTACAAVLGGAASASSGAVAGGEGWIVTVPFSGAAAGRLQVWVEAASAAACALRASAGESDPADDVIARVLASVVSRVAGQVEGTSEGAGLMAGEPASRKALAPEGGHALIVTFDDGLRMALRVSVDLSPAAGATLPSPVSDSRLEAVLEVDLPLVVRFGRAVMPLRAIAELSPGSVVDMGRTPDEPVELLVGERLVARGEVVIVGGNYGVRITELTSGRRATDVEARA
jgi:flagellar motor switch protein FliN/FliY